MECIWTDPAGYGLCKNCGWPPAQHRGGTEARPVRREPLTTNQHILYLLVTVFTFGLGGIIWAWQAVAGNQVLEVAPPSEYWQPPGSIPPQRSWQPPPSGR